MTKIAIIEDDPTISQMYRIKFESSGLDVQMAADGIQGIALVKTYRPDLIMCDLTMPGMDGAQALSAIRRIPTAAHTPVIILTNVGTEEAPQALTQLDIASYIVKANYTPSQVVAKVKQTLGIE